MAAKEISIARYYIKNEKWIAAQIDLNVVEDYDDTVFVEEALFRLVEIYYKLGLENEAKLLRYYWDITIIQANGIKDLTKF